MSGHARGGRRRGGGHSEGHEGGDERWLLTYADMITLLMALFIVMWAISSVNTTKFAELSVSLKQAFNGKLGDPVESSVERFRVTNGEDQSDPVGVEAACDEGERSDRLLIHPLDVVNDAEKRAADRCFREETERGEPYQEPIGDRFAREPERPVESGALAVRKRRLRGKHR